MQGLLCPEPPAAVASQVGAASGDDAASTQEMASALGPCSQGRAAGPTGQRTRFELLLSAGAPYSRAVSATDRPSIRGRRAYGWRAVGRGSPSAAGSADRPLPAAVHGSDRGGGSSGQPCCPAAESGPRGGAALAPRFTGAAGAAVAGTAIAWDAVWLSVRRSSGGGRPSVVAELRGPRAERRGDADELPTCHEPAAVALAAGRECRGKRRDAGFQPD